MRILRALGIVCVVTALLSLAHFMVQWLVFRSPFMMYSAYSAKSSLEIRLSLVAEMLASAVSGVLLIGGLGLLRWRSWSIGALRLYVFSTMALAVARGILSIMATIALQTSHADVPKPPLVPMAIMSVLSTLSSWVWPAFILYILSRQDVKYLWSRKQTGFEVVPLATVESEQGNLS